MPKDGHWKAQKYLWPNAAATPLQLIAQRVSHSQQSQPVGPQKRVQTSMQSISQGVHGIGQRPTSCEGHPGRAKAADRGAGLAEDG
jgi:hypothetical protein